MKPNLATSDIKIFVPAMNFNESLNFYTQLGWQENWKDNNLAELELADCRFYLQNHYNQDWANMHISVEDAKAWWEHAKGVIAEGKYQYARLKEPKQEDYDGLVTYVWDPSGVLLHFAQRLDTQSRGHHD